MSEKKPPAATQRREEEGEEEMHLSTAAKVVGVVACCKIVILWLGCHGNSVGMASHVPLLCVISVAAGWCAQG